MIEKEKQPVANNVSGEKVIVANSFTVQGDLNMGSRPGDKQLALSSFRVDERVIDMTFRNESSSSSIIHAADFSITEVHAVPDQADYFRLPSSYQYNALVSPWDKEFSVSLSQEVPSGSADRFQIILALGRAAQPEHREGPWGYSLIFPPQFPGTDKSVVYARMKMVLRVRYDEGQTIEIAEFETTLNPIGYGYRAKKIAGFTLDEKIELLSDEDVNVVQSVIGILGAIGDPRALDGLRTLRKADDGYLRRYYEREIYAKTDNPRYWDLPNSEKRMASFRDALERTIQYLEGIESKNGNS